MSNYVYTTFTYPYNWTTTSTTTSSYTINYQHFMNYGYVPNWPKEKPKEVSEEALMKLLKDDD